MQQKITKLVAALIVAVFLVSNAGTVISYAAEELISKDKIEKQGTSTNNENVEFDVYFDGEKHTNISSLDSQDTNLNISIKVKNAGYLKDIVISLEDSNYKLVEEEKEEVSILDAENNKIYLNQINNGEEKNITYKIIANNQERIDENFFNKDSKVILSAIYVNAKGKEKEVSKTIILNQEWTAVAQARLQTSLEKYIPYEINGENKIILQEKVVSGIEENTLPIKETNLKISLPRIDEELPETVIVVPTTLEASNGETNGLNFSDSNWSYNKDKGTVNINVKNNEGIDISWKKDSQDEYLVTLIYSADEKTNNQIVNDNFSVEANITVYNNNEETVQAKASNAIDTTRNIGNIADFSSNQTQNLNKGYMYNNKKAADENKKETEYSVIYKTNVTYSPTINKIVINENKSSFITDSDVLLANTGDIYTNTVIISKKAFDKFFAEDGYVKILTIAGEEVAKITSSTKEDNEGNLVINIAEYNLNNIKIETSAPKAEGNIEITVNKVVSKNLSYSLSQIKSFNSIKTETLIEAKKEDKIVASAQIISQANLEEPTAKADIVINKDTLSTVVTNENVEIKAILPMNSVDDLMYENPVVKINLPEYMDEINVNNIQLLYTDELSLGDCILVNNEDGTKAIVANLIGTQTKYSTENMVNGPTILINADITLNKLAPSKVEEISMYSLIEDNIMATAQETIEYSAPTGIVAINRIEGYFTDTQAAIESNSTDTVKTVVLDTYAEKKDAKVTGQVINNQSNEISGVKILGKIPSKDIQTNTFDLMLESIITVSDVNAKVYYSYNTNATNDLKLSSNGWQENIEDLHQVKSFLIVEENNNMQTGADIVFSYMVTIPEQLMHNNSAEISYSVEYTNMSEIATTNETVASPVIKLETGIGADLEVGLTSSAVEQNAQVQRGQYIDFTVTVKNVGIEKANNVKITIPIGEETIYTEFLASYKDFADEYVDSKKIVIGEIEAGETKTVKYTLKIKDTSSNENYPIQTSTKVILTADDLDSQIVSNEYVMNVTKGYIKLVQTTDKYVGTDVTKGDKITYEIKITNITATELQNLVVSEKMPEGLKILDAYSKTSIGAEEKLEGISIDENTNTVTYSASSIPSRAEQYLGINVEVEDVKEAQVSTMAKARATGVGEVTSNELTYEVKQAQVNVQGINPDNKYVKENEEITYEFNIENTGSISLLESKSICEIPEGTEFVKAQIVKDGKTIRKTSLVDGKFEYNASEIGSGEIVNIKITVRTLALANKDDKEVAMNLKLSSENLQEVTSNKVAYIIEYDSKAHNEATNNETSNNTNMEDDNTSTYKITGQVWLDLNKDGKRDENETAISDVEVVLLDANIAKVVKEAIKVEQDGSYEFTELEKGEYLVAFIYPENKYQITEYKKTDVAESVNSDAVSSNITYNGQNRIAGITNTIKITNSNVRDIDLGLIEAQSFDLSLEKKISKIAVYNGKETEALDYTARPKDLAKIEIQDKYLDTSTVTVEYTIKVTNNGGVAGYAKNIVDYLPSDLKFNSELNTDWYQGRDGNLYTTALANTIINPGESKTVTLTLSKKMTRTNTGTVNNRAEIYESYNEQAIADINSTPGNKVASENDMDAVDLIISVKTGEVAVYSLLGLTVIAMIGCGVFEIKRKVLDKKI